MTLADRARQVADAAPKHQSAEVLRECATELDHLSQRADHLGTSAQEWYGMWNIASERANKAEAELAALRHRVVWRARALAAEAKVRDIQAALTDYERRATSLLEVMRVAGCLEGK